MSDIVPGCTVAYEGAWAVEQHFAAHLERAEGTLASLVAVRRWQARREPAGAFVRGELAALPGGILAGEGA
jgi:hypothetical protein